MWLTMDGKDYYFENSEIRYCGQSRMPRAGCAAQACYHGRKRYTYYLNYDLI